MKIHEAFEKIIELRKPVCFVVLSPWDLQDHNVPSCVLSIVEKLLKSRVAARLFHNVILFWIVIIENSKSN
jgi:hypothetical protein